MNKVVQRDLYRQLRKKYFIQIGADNLRSAFASALLPFMKQQKGTWAAYRSFDDEADLSQLISSVDWVDWVFPKVINSDLKFYKPDQISDFATNSWGIEEPVVERSQLVQNQDISGFLIPAVALDRDGTRLGMGKGFYDRALSGVSAFKVGVAYQVQISQIGLPLEDHDIRMDFLATDAGVVAAENPLSERTAL